MNESTASKVSDPNWQTRQRLKLALTLGLRRQIFIAICDNFRLKEEIINELNQELGNPQNPQEIEAQGYPKLVTLNINLDNPNLLLQIAQWLKQHPLPANNIASGNQTILPSFQFMGIELLTGQPAEVQQSFLRNLLAVERHLPQLDSNLLLWLPQNWLHLIKQSVPEFWRWHTSVFWFQKEVNSLPGAIELFSKQDSSFPSFGSNSSSTSSSLSNFPPQQPTKNSHFQQNGRAQAQKVPPLVKFTTENQPLEQEAPVAVATSTAQLAQEPTQFYSLSEIAELQKSASPGFVAEAYVQLGNHYREKISEGDKTTDNLTTAIEAYTLALQWLGEQDHRIPEILNDKGNIYWMLSRQPQLMQEATLYLEQAIDSYHGALDKIIPQVAPQTYAMIQNNLGAAYNDLSRYQNSPENLELAIRAYQDALTYRTVEKDPHKYASTQNNLGTAYWHLAQQQEPMVNLKAAVEAYNEALTQYHPEQDPLNWAMIQNNLGTAYWNLAQYEEPEVFLRLAIKSYQKSLKYRTQDLDPVACAATQNNLGTTYWHLGSKLTEEADRQTECYHNAIAAYEIAITIAERLALIDPPLRVNFDLVAARNNLGLVHYQLAMDVNQTLTPEDKNKHLEIALQAHLQALQEAAPETDNYKNTFNYIVNAVRIFYKEGGLQGQNYALSQVPGELLPKILPLLSAS